MKGKKEEEKGNENGDVKTGEKLKTKEYDKELAKLHVRTGQAPGMGQVQEAQGLRRFRGARRCRQGGR